MSTDTTATIRIPVSDNHSVDLKEFLERLPTTARDIARVLLTDHPGMRYLIPAIVKLSSELGEDEAALVYRLATVGARDIPGRYNPSWNEEAKNPHKLTDVEMETADIAFPLYTRGELSFNTVEGEGLNTRLISYNRLKTEAPYAAEVKGGSIVELVYKDYTLCSIINGHVLHHMMMTEVDRKLVQSHTDTQRI